MNNDEDYTEEEVMSEQEEWREQDDRRRYRDYESETGRIY